jgi:hypothetical protein
MTVVVVAGLGDPELVALADADPPGATVGAARVLGVVAAALGPAEGEGVTRAMPGSGP